MKLLWLPVIFIAVCCGGCAETGSGGVSKEDFYEARKRRVILPDMTAPQVLRIWPQPDRVVSHGRLESWVYHSGPRGTGHDISTTITFTDGRVSEVVNGDIMTRIALISGPGTNVFLPP